MTLADQIDRLALGQNWSVGDRATLRIAITGLEAGKAQASTGAMGSHTFQQVVITGDLDVPAGHIRIGTEAGNRGNVLITSQGIKLRQGITTKIDLQTDGDVFIGTNTAAAATTNIAIFTTAQTYNSENVDVGDLLLGDNTTSKANLYWDKSAGTLAFRSGVTPTITIGTDGIMTFASALSISINNSSTNQVDNVLNITHTSTGTVAAGFGSGIQFRAEIGSDGSTINQAYIQSLWADGVDGFGRLTFSTRSNVGFQEGIRIESLVASSAMALGFYGATAVVKPAATDDLRTALINLGLYTTGGASPLNLNGGAFTTTGVATVDSLNVGTATGAASGAVKISGATDNQLIIASVTTNNTRKNANVALTAYVTAQVPFGLIYGDVNTGADNELNIGGGHSGVQAATSVKIRTASAVNTATGTTQLLIDSTGKATFTADVVAGSTISSIITDAGTTSAVTGLVIEHRSSGTPAASFGVDAFWNMESTTTDARNAGLIRAEWVVATDASRTARMYHYVYDTAAREAIRLQASGSAAMIGFLGAAAVIRQPAITQTYSTAATTLTQTTMTDPAAYGAGANGYSTGAMASAVHAEVIALKANMVVTQNVLNTVIDYLQSFGFTS